ncbi:MAG: recombinase family protein [Nocardioides sp.]
MKGQGKRLSRPRTLPAEVTARIGSARREGQTLAGIADSLNRDVVATARGGARWYASTVKAILTSAALDEAAA